MHGAAFGRIAKGDHTRAIANGGAPVQDIGFGNGDRACERKVVTIELAALFLRSK